MPLPAGRDALDAGPVGAGLRLWRHRGPGAGARARRARRAAALACSGLHTAVPGPATADAAVSRVFPAGPVRPGPERLSFGDHRIDLLRQRVLRRNLARLDTVRAAD